ncbi:DNA recombination protein RmuC [Roseococcus sp. SYP-B2431]|uniref:DNA recombination protein RmuC n=1 Tax=Roseococcus sp. SYP-B2431 TaxID=2496640 RepID=UPI001F0CE8B6|nr:DNA recombination protein RmuC [Roseococcus sp. SYP-B2431]
MTVEAALLGVVVLLLLAVLAVLLTRRPPGDPTLPLLQAGQERQAAALATTKEALAGDIARQKTELSLELSGFTAEQTRALGAAMLKQTESLAATERALLDRLAAGAALTQETTAAQTKAVNAAMLKQAESLAVMQTSLLERLTADAKATQEAMSAETARSRDVLDKKLTEMRENSEKRLAEIQKSVNEQLASAVEKQMNESFQRVIDQFTAVQKAMGDVQAVTAQIGDIKRLFGNVKTRGGWGETQVKALLDDILPEGSYEVNVRLREGSSDSVEFCVVMPMSGSERVLLPVDAKFPIEDYERLLAAWEIADPIAEIAARKGLENRIRGEAQKIAQKYICPPRTVEFGVMYLPTEGLYAEVARIPGLIDDVGRVHRVLILGPTLLPALLRTIQLGHVTLALSKNAESVRELLSATKAEMSKMDGVLSSLGKQVGTVANTIGRAQVRTRAITRKLRGMDTLPGERVDQIFEIEQEIAEDEEA